MDWGLQWLHAHRVLLNVSFWTAMVISVAGIVLIPWLIGRIPRDYFARAAPPPLPWADAHPVLRGFLAGMKNLLGALLVLVGVAMLVLPGQGILTLMIGLMLVDFPGKRAMELKVVRRPRVRRVLDWIRARVGREPLQVGPLDGGRD